VDVKAEFDLNHLNFETKEGHRRGTGEIIAGGRLPFYADLVRMVRSPGILEDTRALQKHTRSRDGSPFFHPSNSVTTTLTTARSSARVGLTPPPRFRYYDNSLTFWRAVRACGVSGRTLGV
jgi:hypothetical protein